MPLKAYAIDISATETKSVGIGRLYGASGFSFWHEFPDWAGYSIKLTDVFESDTNVVLRVAIIASSMQHREFWDVNLTTKARSRSPESLASPGYYSLPVGEAFHRIAGETTIQRAPETRIGVRSIKSGGRLEPCENPIREGISLESASVLNGITTWHRDKTLLILIEVYNTRGIFIGGNCDNGYQPPRSFFKLVSTASSPLFKLKDQEVLIALGGTSSIPLTIFNIYFLMDFGIRSKYFVSIEESKYKDMIQEKGIFSTQKSLLELFQR